MEWTFEAMIDSCCVVHCSLDGDDDMNSSQDMWGYVADEDSLYRLYHGASRQFAHVDEQGHLAYDFGTDEGSVNDMKLIIVEFLYADDWYLDPNGNGKVFLGEGEDLFTKGKALFKDGMVKDIVTELSDMEDMYGILPFPLYDVDQETYCSLVDPYHDSLVAIPEHESRKDMCATVLEMLSSANWPHNYTSERAQITFCLSKPDNGTKPAPDRLQTEFYVAIKEYIGCKCYQCIDMMRIISDTRSYDPGLYWDNGTGLHGEEGLPRVSSIITYDIQGLWEGFCAKVEENVREINDWIDAGESSTEIE